MAKRLKPLTMKSTPAERKAAMAESNQRAKQMKEAFTEDIERDAKIFETQLYGGHTLSQIAPLVMQMPGFEGGPDRLFEYAKWISAPERREYRSRVVNLIKGRKS